MVDSARGRARSIGTNALVVAGAVLLLLGGVLLYARQEVFDSHAFAVHATHTLDDESVRKAVGDAVLDQVTQDAPPQLLSFRPAFETVLHGVVQSSPFHTIFRRAARHTHDLLFQRTRDNVLLDLADAGLTLTSAAKAISPDLARHIPKDIKPGLLELTKRDWATDLLDVADHVRFLGLVLPALSLLCFAGAVATARDRRLTVIRIGGWTAAVAAVALVGLFAGRAALLDAYANESDALHGAVGAAWDAFFDGLHTWALVVGAFGLILAAAASSVLRPVDAASPAQRAWGLITRPPVSTGGRVARAAVGLAFGLLLLLEPADALEAAVTIAGAYVIYFACTEILGVIELVPGEELRAVARERRHRRALSLALATPVLVVLVAVVVLTSGGGSAAARGDAHPKACNGFAALCNRSLNQVAFAATHNSMSAARRRGWFFANQSGGISEQLDAGMRGLLIDTHYAYGSSGGLGLARTALTAEGRDLEDVKAEIGPAATKAALRLAGRIGGKPSGGRRVYLCHVLCELGDTPVVDGLREVRRFLDRHPDEVLITFIEDKVSARDTARAFRDAGLLRYVYTHKREDQWPTLRQMIRRNRRLFVMYEAGPGDARIPWYHNGFDLTQETPYKFHNQGQLAAPASCTPNRGTASSPLFQVNHWIDATPPPPGAGTKSNRYETLLARAQMCQRSRGLLPNIVGVDFYEQGDVRGVVNVLNGLSRTARPSVRTR